MKKIVYTLSFLAFFTLASKAQTPSAAPQQEPKKEVAPEKKTAQPSSSTSKKEETATGTAPRTRMAINEKGVPASKATTPKDKKDEKTTSTPGQPATEKH